MVTFSSGLVRVFVRIAGAFSLPLAIVARDVEIEQHACISRPITIPFHGGD
jgi:hypothetical protein